MILQCQRCGGLFADEFPATFSGAPCRCAVPERATYGLSHEQRLDLLTARIEDMEARLRALEPQQ